MGKNSNGAVGKDFPISDLERDLLVFCFGLVDQLVHRFVEALFVVLLAVAFLIQHAVGFEAKALESVGQIADLDIPATGRLSVGLLCGHTGIIGNRAGILRMEPIG